AQDHAALGVALHVFVAGAAGQRIADRPQVAVLLLAHHLQVGDGGLQHRVPVDQALPAVDEAFLVHAHDSLDHRLRRARVHGEDAARPVPGGPHAAHLALDGVAGPALPLPDLGDEALAAQRVAGLAAALAVEVARHHHLG